MHEAAKLVLDDDDDLTPTEGSLEESKWAIEARHLKQAVFT